MLVESASSLCKPSAAPLVAYFRISCLQYASRSSSSRTSRQRSSAKVYGDEAISREIRSLCRVSRTFSVFFLPCTETNTSLRPKRGSRLRRSTVATELRATTHNPPSFQPYITDPSSKYKRVVHRALRSCLEEDGASRKVFQNIKSRIHASCVNLPRTFSAGRTVGNKPQLP